MTPELPPHAAVIPARFKRQAMDWSLVLASQGIETSIECSPEGNHWFLVVPPQDHQRAWAAIQQYRLENRGWVWRQKLHGTGIWFHWGALLWCLLLGLVYWLDAAHGNGLRAVGMVDSAAARAGKWWQLFTAICLHSSLAHLAANLTTGLLLLGLAMARYGAGVALLAAFVAGAGGNVAGLCLYHGPYHGLGASGMVMGALGLLAMHSLFLWKASPRAAKYIFSGVMSGFMLFVLFGLDPASDVIAHAGGFVSGGLLGAGLSFLPPRWVQNGIVNFLAGLCMVALISWTWWLALV